MQQQIEELQTIISHQEDRINKLYKLAENFQIICESQEDRLKMLEENQEKASKQAKDAETLSYFNMFNKGF